MTNDQNTEQDSQEISQHPFADWNDKVNLQPACYNTVEELTAKDLSREEATWSLSLMEFLQ